MDSIIDSFRLIRIGWEIPGENPTKKDGKEIDGVQ